MFKTLNKKVIKLIRSKNLILFRILKFSVFTSQLFKNKLLKYSYIKINKSVKSVFNVFLLFVFLQVNRFK